MTRILIITICSVLLFRSFGAVYCICSESESSVKDNRAEIDCSDWDAYLRPLTVSETTAAMVDFENETCRHVVYSENSLRNKRHLFTNNSGKETLNLFVRFRGPSDAHVFLTTQNNSERETGDLYEIVIGSADNTKSEIRLRSGITSRYSTMKSLGTPKILTAGLYRGFHFRFNPVNGSLGVYTEKNGEAILHWVAPNPLPIRYFSFSSYTGKIVHFAYNCSRKDVLPSPSTDPNPSSIFKPIADPHPSSIFKPIAVSVISLMNLLVFLLPPVMFREKIIMGSLNFFMISMFIIYLQLKIPSLVLLYVGNLVLISIGLAISVVVLNLTRTPRVSSFSFPQYLRIFCNAHFATLLGVGHLVPFISKKHGSVDENEAVCYSGSSSFWPGKTNDVREDDTANLVDCEAPAPYKVNAEWILLAAMIDRISLIVYAVANSIVLGLCSA